MQFESNPTRPIKPRPRSCTGPPAAPTSLSWCSDALGVSPMRARLTGVAAVVLLAGAAVAGAGPIAFVGLAVPHLVRLVTGPDHRQVMLGCLVTGPVLLLTADMAGRVIMTPLELEVGIVTAFLGAPVLFGLARYSKVVTRS